MRCDIRLNPLLFIGFQVFFGYQLHQALIVSEGDGELGVVIDFDVK